MANRTTDKSNEPSLLSKALKIIAFPIAAVSGWLVGKIHVQNAAYDNARFMNAFFDIKDDVKEKKTIEVVAQEVVEKEGYHTQLKKLVKTAVEEKVIAKPGTIDIYELTQDLRTENKALVTERMEKIGLGTLRKQWKFNMHYQRRDAIINSLTVAGIAIGAILSIANMKAVQHLFSKQEAEQKTGRGSAV
jgi:hypothetical protein